LRQQLAARVAAVGVYQASKKLGVDRKTAIKYAMSKDQVCNEAVAIWPVYWYNYLSSDVFLSLANPSLAGPLYDSHRTRGRLFQYLLNRDLFINHNRFGMTNDRDEIRQRLNCLLQNPVNRHRGHWWQR
jgi:hypothetical protein